MSDPTAHLAAHLREEIRRAGFISVAAYMDMIAAGYYARGDVFGVKGDFTTAPEISQAFGEIIGLWCAVTWQQMGKPHPFRLIECGPGRGTLMADLLRAANQVPEFTAAAEIHLVERSEALRAVQKRTLGKGSITPHNIIWHDDFSTTPSGPCLVICNEFLDALPIRQFQRTAHGWAERVVELDGGGQFRFGTQPVDNAPIPIPIAMAAEVGAVFEYSEAVAGFVGAVAQRVVRDGGAALLIDYGHTVSAAGDTLQAVKQHQYVPVLQNPGSADLTAHVDFAAVKNAGRTHGANVFGPVEQGTWLKQLGIGVRQVQLARGKPPEVARTVEEGVRRLTEPHGMGALFKVIALTHPGLPMLEGFAAGS
ncbi:MAG: SAM-dependent methyltransferase [Rhodospirillaceae bacterium]|nr:SAM-dependent methyltransferase [Rhodospirillaceae bacterium]